METWKLLSVGIIVHVIFFYSIFDIYFSSPIVHGMTPQLSPLKPPAKRLVLFVADGLRADRCFELDLEGRPRTPFLRFIIEEQGAWGISHTRVPTESRPGHVAIIAGFYEDVSAVAKGWKENPVEFDSVFNESRFTWSWGSPDILPMFAKGASRDHVYTKCYTAMHEDFAGSDSSKLDTWVFDHVQAFMESSHRDESLKKKLNQDKIVFFLHLLGIDTNGHSHKPYSQEYLKNIHLVDEGIKKMYHLFEEFYPDRQTAYIMSADHGMTNWGSHGAGHPSETLTPLVAWGAGIRGPIHNNQVMDTFSKDWKLENIQRFDVEQAAISPLMASLIGVPFPLNSVGVLPIDYLNVSLGDKAETLFANTRQILQQYQVKMEEKKSTTLSAVFRPFRSDSTPIKILRDTGDSQSLLLSGTLPFSEKSSSNESVDDTRHIQNLIHSGQYNIAILQCHELIEKALRGLNYFQTYDRFFLGVSISLGFLGWTAYILSLLLEEHSGIYRPKVRVDKSGQPSWKSQKWISLMFTLLGVVIIILLYAQSLPWTNYLYCLVPVTLWAAVASRSEVLIAASNKFIQSADSTSVITLILSFVGLEILVLGFFHRELLSFGLICLGLWPVSLKRKDMQWGLFMVWFGLTLGLAIFPLLPVVGRETNYNIVVLCGVILIVVSLIYIIQIGITIIVVKTTSLSIFNKQGLPWLNQLLSWIILALSFIEPLLVTSVMPSRLLSIVLSFMSTYILLSTHEAMFVLSLCGVLCIWIQLEASLSHIDSKKLETADFSLLHSSIISHPRRSLEFDDVRRASFFISFLKIFFILTSFFGTGNIASINSFDPASVYCFLTVFDPFVMGALMMWKNVIPFVFVTCAFRAIHVITRVPIRELFLLVLIMTDIMALHFFFLVQDYGSWLDIGTSISHYVIVMSMIIFLMLLFGLSYILTNVQILSRKFHK
ncbi:hypothetical protein ACJMK2_009129 [Sinanodonta woodiana]|uniref:GPI ethanolamine phosphate transferase 1 n=1 Tax=Sinanodonta woodiana TaxID=1069815 RepID=A0ABD3VED9_SINWO